MLACLGPVVFDVITDLQSIDGETASSLAKHDVLGSAPVYENTGDEESTFTLRGTLHPHFVAELQGKNALAGIAALEAARQARVPLPFMGGNFIPRGFVIIKSISRQDSELSPFDGVGSEVQYTVNLIRVGSPGVGLAETILRIFL